MTMLKDDEDLSAIIRDEDDDGVDDADGDFGRPLSLIEEFQPRPLLCRDLKARLRRVEWDVIEVALGGPTVVARNEVCNV